MNTEEKSSNGLLKVGLIGTVIAALCCFTPVLVVLFGAVGLAAVVGYLDFVLLPALGIFILLTIYALWRKNARNTQSQRN
ncbi:MULTISPECIES: mercury resistance system transport protein MerF [Leisingera]|uniref:mercury resistance system transport protein MerF n=1 Tax=Leisingera TaxID=191028 RepID=UPI00041F8BDB|nr:MULTISPECIES: mercury resistance system transport protein MerF [Leisingera]